MSGYETIEVPFVIIGNRRGLTAEQIYGSRALEDFVKAFPASFEWQHCIETFLFIEPEISTNVSFSAEVSRPQRNEIARD